MKKETESEKEIEEEPKRKRIGSMVADALLGVLVIALLALQIDIIVTSRQNHGVPSIFGYSFMKILTDSMDGPEDDRLLLTYKKDMPSAASKEVDPLKETRKVQEVFPLNYEHLEEAKAEFDYGYLIKNGPLFLHVDTGIVIQKVDFKEIMPGDVITFLYDINIGGAVYNDEPTSHRVIEINHEAGTLSCFGDNNMPYGGSRMAYYSDPSQRNDIVKADVLGKVISASDGLGSVLGITQNTWFLPVMILIPLLLIGGISAFDAIKKGHLERKKEKDELAAAIAAAGIDANDEVAVETFTTRYLAKREIQMELEIEKEKQKEIFRQAFEEEKKKLKAQGGEEDPFEKIKREEKQRLRAELKKEASSKEEDPEKAALIAKIKEEEKAKLRAAMKAKEQKKAPKVEEEDEKAKLLAKIKEEEKARIKAELLAKERGMKDEA